MGQRNCKTRVTLPSDPPCFPFFSQEKDLLVVCKTASNSLTQLRKLLCVVSGFVLDTSQMSTTSFCISATTALIQFAIDRLCQDDMTGQSQSETGNQSQETTLEDSLLEIKIDKCIVKSAVLCLKAKLTAIRNRYNRLILQELSTEDRRLEVIPALSLCEEIVELFRDPENVFAKNPIVSTPFMVTFAGVYVAVAEHSIAILPSYRTFLTQQMKLLEDTLRWYKNGCIQERQDCLKFKRSAAMPDSWMDGVCTSLEVENVEDFHLHDPFMNKECYKSSKLSAQLLSEEEGLKDAEEYDSDSTTIVDNSDEFIQYQSTEEAMSVYKMRLEKKYDAFFDGILKNVAEFSGFNEEAISCHYRTSVFVMLDAPRTTINTDVENLS